MSWTKFTCFFAFCALLAAPVMAQPALTIDLVGGGSSPTLGGSGGLVWTIGVDPDENQFDTPATGDNAGVNGATTALDIGFDLSGGSDAASAAANATNFDTNNPGNNTFGDEVADGAGDFVGVQVGSDASNVFASIGSVYLASGAPLEALTISSEALTTANLVASVAWSGDLGQGGSFDDQISVSGSASYTATAGDADLTGGVTLDDFNTVLFNFGTGTTWSLGNFDGDANTDLDDFNTVLFNFGNASGSLVVSGSGSLSTTNIPEPGSLAILAGIASVTLLVNSRNRRS